VFASNNTLSSPLAGAEEQIEQNNAQTFPFSPSEKSATALGVCVSAISFWPEALAGLLPAVDQQTTCARLSSRK
jgi:hypothetical protein